jgi:hypothetical protein
MVLRILSYQCSGTCTMWYVLERGHANHVSIEQACGLADLLKSKCCSSWFDDATNCQMERTMSCQADYSLPDSFLDTMQLCWGARQWSASKGLSSFQASWMRSMSWLMIETGKAENLSTYITEAIWHWLRPKAGIILWLDWAGPAMLIKMLITHPMFYVGIAVDINQVRLWVIEPPGWC